MISDHGIVVELSIVIPTRRREAVLAETLRRLLEQGEDRPVELIVVHDGDSGSERREAWRLASSAQLPLRVAEQRPLGPAAARNRGLAMSRGPAVLFLGDDVWARPGLLDRHLSFHREHPERGAALLGRVVPAPPLDRSPFVRWLHTAGVQFGYGNLDAGPVAAECFWTANVSAKKALIQESGGFDERFENAACEDAELGLRAARLGMQLLYDPEAIAEHYHPTNLARTLERMRVVGRAFRLLAEREPDLPMPRRPGPRHRIAAAALTALAALRISHPPIRERSWRFLCDEAQREAFWGIEPPGDRILRIGERLARLQIAAEPRVALPASRREPERAGVGG